jgi:TonB family protein
MKKIVLMTFVLAGCSSSVDRASPTFASIEEPELAVNTSDRRYWVPVVKVHPIYPRRALLRKVQGCVNVTYVVTAEGKVINPQVLKSQPEGVFDEAAINAASAFEYEPGDQNPDRVPIRTYNVFTFTLAEGQSGSIARYWNHQCEI